MPGTVCEDQYTFLSHLSQFFLKWETFPTKVVENIKAHISCSIIFFFRKSCRLWDNVEKCSSAGQATDDNMAHANCMLDTGGYEHVLRMCFQSKVLRIITDAPRYLPSAVIKRDLKVLSVRQEVLNYSVTYRQRLDDHPNRLAKSLFQRTNYNPRLKR